MHVRPVNMHCHVRNASVPGICGVNCFHVGLSNRVRNCEPIFYADTSRFYMQIPSETIDVRQDLFSLLFILLQYPVSNLLQHRSLGGEACH